MLDRLYLCTSCGKIILVNLYQYDKLEKITGFIDGIRKYLNGNPIIAFRDDVLEDNYIIRDKVSILLSDCLIPESFMAKTDSEILKIVALRYSTISKINIFHLDKTL